MLFLTQIIGTKIYDNHNDKIGYIQDIIVKPTEDYPAVVGLEIDSLGEKFFVNYKYIEALGEKLSTLNISKKKLCKLEIHSGDLFLVKDLLERQIVDLKGVKIVRVNDIQLGKIGDKLCLMSIAVGNKSILRRLGLDFFANLLKIQDKFIRWGDFNLVDIPSKSTKDLHLSMIREDLIQLHPADIANVIEELNTKQSRHFIEAISDVSDEFAAEVFEEIDEPKKLTNIVMNMKSDKVADIVEEMEPDEAADLIADLPENKAEEVLKLMEDEESEDVEELLSYEEDSVGGLMNTDFVSVLENTTIQKTIEYIKKISTEFDNIYYLYAIDEKGHLKGVVSLRTLLIEPKTKMISQIMQKNMITVKPGDSHQKVIKKLTKYNLLSICVVDKNNKLLGVVTVDDAIRLLVPNA